MLVSLPKGKCPRLGCRLLGGSYIPKLSEKFSVEAKELAGARGPDCGSRSPKVTLTLTEVAIGMLVTGKASDSGKGLECWTGGLRFRLLIATCRVGVVLVRIVSGCWVWSELGVLGSG